MTEGRCLPAEFFAANRQRLMDAQPSSIFVFGGNREMQARGDMAYPFRQEANFWWLTGLEAPDWWLIIDGKSCKSYLVMPDHDATRAVFDGEMAVEDVRAATGVSDVMRDADALALLHELARKHSVAYGLGPDPHDGYYHFIKNSGPKETWQKLDRIFNGVQDVRKTLSKLRAIKQPAEIAAIRKAIAITADGFSTVKSRIAEYHHEYEIEAEFSYLFRKNGYDGHAYDPIVAAGKNACTLHYSANADRISKRQLVLLDIGAKYAGYPADITRTYAVGTPTKRQIAVHSAVQKAHYAIIDLLRPGLPVQDYAKQVDAVMQRALQSLDLIHDPDDEDNYRRYFPHAVSHGLGVDVHDSLGGFATFQEGMVLTVEPGIYIPEEEIGVRIEDNILITNNGYENLSRALSTDY